MTEPIHETLRGALTAFFSGVVRSAWQGREREAVSHFVFSYLVPRCRPGSDLRKPGQIGIEVAVPGVPSLNPKPQVCKDVVIWGEAGETCWDSVGKPSRAPRAILEWKCHRSPVSNEYSAHDVEWLKAFTARWPGTTGMLIRLSLSGRAPRLDAGLVLRGSIDETWLSLPGAV